jgi:hypothetical protein
VRRAVLTLVLLASLLAAPTANAEFGFVPGAGGFSAVPSVEGGERSEQAGSHPFVLTTDVNFKLAPESPDEPGVQFTDGDLKDLTIDLPPGLIENPSTIIKCTEEQFETPRSSPFEPSRSGESCPAKSQIGTIELRSSFGGGSTHTFGLFNLAPPPGSPSRIGASPYGTPIVFTPRLRETGAEFGVSLDLRNFPQRFDTYGFTLKVWGTPWNLAHDGQRGNCLNEVDPAFPNAKCSVGSPALSPRQAYLTLPTSCDVPVTFKATATSWQQPGSVVATSSGPRLEGCDDLLFDPAPLARLNTDRAGSMSGFDFTLQGDTDGLTDPRMRASSQVKKAVVRMPVGMTVNPSIGAGLGVCTAPQFAAETLSSPPGAGCPNASKIGELTVKSPLFDGEVKGGLFLAQPDDPLSPGSENPFDALIALYLVAKAPERGVMVRLSGKTEPDPVSGQLTTTFDGLPQLPYTTFNVHFRDGQRTPLATPATCGVYNTEVRLSPWLEPADVAVYNSPFALKAGIGGGPCPVGTPPFNPGAVNGMVNRAAGAYTPFYMRLSRTDAEQEITSYSATFPPGLLGKLKGIPYCPEAALEVAKRNTGVAEQRNPSCPAASQIGRTYSGYGLGSVLAYAPGNLYLAGPYGGSPFSIVAVNSALVGPFDLGVIIVRSAIRIDRRTAQVSVDSSDSDPIPHILDGIPLHLRDIRVYLDRPGFMLNPTSCNPFAAVSSLTGSGPSFASTADDVAVAVPSPFQVSACSGLLFKPRMSFKLRNGNRRGQYPKLQAVVRPRPGNANIGYSSVLLPPSLFLAQEHIDTLCTRRQFDAKNCPPGSLYGHAKAITPLLGQPLEGPVYLRASDNLLPDLVADLQGAGVRIEVGGKIDSVNGGMRATFTVLPDAPVTKFTMNLKGGKKGLIAISDNLCKVKPKAVSRMGGQNNVGTIVRSPIGVECPKGGKGKGKGK